MNTQINLRMPDELLEQSLEYAKKNGFGNVQELIKESLREKLFEDGDGWIKMLEDRNLTSHTYKHL